MNRYITKIVRLVYPQLKKTEFDLAFEGDANPIRDRILDYLDKKIKKNFIET
jgi:hemolysin-activating ACP:hemolysin acyltransferase